MRHVRTLLPHHTPQVLPVRQGPWLLKRRGGKKLNMPTSTPCTHSVQWPSRLPAFSGRRPCGLWESSDNLQYSSHWGSKVHQLPHSETLCGRPAWQFSISAGHHGLICRQWSFSVLIAFVYLFCFVLFCFRSYFLVCLFACLFFLVFVLFIFLYFVLHCIVYCIFLLFISLYFFVLFILVYILNYLYNYDNYLNEEKKLNKLLVGLKTFCVSSNWFLISLQNLNRYIALASSCVQLKHASLIHVLTYVCMGGKPHTDQHCMNYPM